MTCLVVDDSATMRRICRRALAAAGCAEVHEAASRAEAEAAMAAGAPGLVITGRHLPDADVLDYVRALRAAQASADTPVLMISDRGQQAAVQAACEAGVTSYLLRPFTMPALQQRIEALLALGARAPREADGAAPAIGGGQDETPEAQAA